MNKDLNPQNTRGITVLFYSTCFVVFLGLFATVGINMLLSHMFLWTASDTSYLYAFQRVNGTLFWWGTGVMGFVGVGCFILFRFFESLVHTKNLVPKRHILAGVLRQFFYHVSIVVVLGVISWVGIQHVLMNLSDAITAHTLPPLMEQEPLYENRADYYQKTTPFEFSLESVVKET